MRTGLVRARPSANRVNVDELRWAGLSAIDKQALLAFVLCDMSGKQPGEMTFEDMTVAYGYRTGKRLAMLTSVGMSFE